MCVAVYMDKSFVYLQLKLDQAIISTWQDGAQAKLDKFSFSVWPTRPLHAERVTGYRVVRAAVIGYKVSMALMALLYVVVYAVTDERQLKVSWIGVSFPPFSVCHWW